MITFSDAAQGILAGYSFTLHYRLSSWLGGDCLAEDIPAVDVVEEIDGAARVPERLTFRVPVESDGASWVPLSYDAPLGTWGQRIIAQVGVGVGAGAVEWIDRGEFVIVSVETEGASISVECGGLLYLMDEAVLPTEYQPRTSATFNTIIRALVEPGLTCKFTDAPTNRAAPSGITYSDNRLDNLYSVADAWPALVQTQPGGWVELSNPLNDPTAADVVFAFTDEDGGTVVEWNTSLTREGAFNAVVAKGQYPDTAGAKAGQEIVATVFDTDSESPFRQGGPFSGYVVPHGYASPLLTTLSETFSAANTRMQNLRKQASRTVRITAVPHPGLQQNDAVSVTSSRLGLAAELGRIEALTLPYSGAGGSMGLTVRLVD